MVRGALISLAALLGTASSRRVKVDAKIHEQVGMKNKLIDGVPILNYDLAYGGSALMQTDASGASKQLWVMVLRKNFHARALCGLFGGCIRQGHPQDGGVAFVEVAADEKTIVKFLRVPGMKAMVKFIEPSTEAHLIPEFEAKAAASWGLDRVGASKRPNGGAQSHIYVMDTGVRPTHEDFGGRVIPTLDMTSGSAVECGPNPAANCTNDAQGHGTHCAGTTSGEKYGIAPAATVHAVKVLSDEGSGSWSWSYEALDWIATKGERPAVASMSLGGRLAIAAMGEAVDSAVEAGVVVVVAGGNDNDDACGYSPAYIASAITVGSTTSEDARSSFSNYGPCTQIWAPGSDITSASHEDDTGSATMSGTSMACPHVSGAAALLLDEDPTLSSSEVLEKLYSMAEDGVITDLKEGDTNRLLYVGSDASSHPPLPPTPKPTGAPWPCAWWCGAWSCSLSAECAGCDVCS